jgi:spore coat protein U-like protein
MQYGGAMRERIRSGTCALAAGLLLLCWNTVAPAAGTCTISAVGVAFGNYNPASPTPDTANGSLLATCNWTSGGATTFTLTTSFSPGNSGSYPNRWMLRPGSTDHLNYNIYMDAGFTQIRGNGTAGTVTGGPSQVTVSRNNRTATASGTLYGRIPAGQNASPGNYSDTIVVTLTF